MKALIIEDDIVKQIMFKEFIKDYTKNIDFASTKKQASILLQEKEYDYIFIDHFLPDGHGSDMISEINRINPNSQKISISYDNTILYSFDMLGYNDVITHPFTKNIERVFCHRH